MASHPEAVSSGLLDRLEAGDVAAMSRAITVVENGKQGSAELMAGLAGRKRLARIVGFTGAPGVGKSTLISAYISELRSGGQRVAVVSIDPSSPLSGGAILGDRLRMDKHISDPGVYIRSGAARGHLGGLSRNIQNIVRVIDVAGWDVIILETVGTGQSEVEVAGIADVCVLVTCPGMGDEIQAMKSGVLDIADILVVNKSDQPDAGQTTRALRGMLQLREESRQAVPVIETVATEGTGMADLALAVDTRGQSKNCSTYSL
jgi:LAO/AO transport system kinase